MSLCGSMPPATAALKTSKARRLSSAGKRQGKGRTQGEQSVRVPELCTQSPTNKPGSISAVCRSVLHTANPRVLSCHLEYAASRSVQQRCCKPATSQAVHPGLPAATGCSCSVTLGA